MGLWPYVNNETEVDDKEIFSTTVNMFHFLSNCAENVTENNT